MNIVMFTNTFTPHVGGVARSVQGFVDDLRQLGHRVLVVAPEFDNQEEHETDVLRIPALQNFNGSDFSLPAPASVLVTGALDEFRPDVVHSHHPFLLGHTALRIAASLNVPVIYTCHTRYEQYTHYLPGDSEPLKHFVNELVLGYCNLCNAVIAPSGSIADLLRAQEVTVPIEVIPTGVQELYFTDQEQAAARRQMGIPAEAFVLGHVGRLAPEKNLAFLSEAVCRFLETHPLARFLLVGDGPARAEMIDAFEGRNLLSRVHMFGVLERDRLARAYRCMDVFVFASQSETQGMVLAEAMAAGTPVVAVDASGVREIVIDRDNGRLLPVESLDLFVLALDWLIGLPEAQRAELSCRAVQTARRFAREHSVQALLGLYSRLIGAHPSLQEMEDSGWQRARSRIQKEIDILKNYGHAIEDTLQWIPQREKSL